MIMNSGMLTDAEILKGVIEKKEKGELLVLAKESGVSIVNLMSFVQSSTPLSFDDRFMLSAVLGE